MPCPAQRVCSHIRSAVCWSSVVAVADARSDQANSFGWIREEVVSVPRLNAFKLSRTRTLISLKQSVVSVGAAGRVVSRCDLGLCCGPRQREGWRMMKARQTIMKAAAAVVAVLGAASSHASGATIGSIYSADTAGSVTVTGAEVVDILDANYVSGTTTYNSIILSDGTGSILDYKIKTSVYTPTLGDIITVTAPNSPFNGAPELTNPTSVTITSQGNTVPTPPIVTVAGFNSATSNTGAVAPLSESIVTLDDVVVNGGSTSTLAAKTSYNFTDSTGTGVIYTSTSYSQASAGLTSLNTAIAASNGGPLDVTGYVDSFVSSTTGVGTSELYVISATPYAAVTSVPLPKSVPASAACLLLVGGSAVVRRRRAA